MDVTQGLCRCVYANTIAGLCKKVRRVELLKSEQIGLLPFDGYHGNRTQSARAIRWLEYCAREDSIYICHRDNGGEQKVGLYYVDGFCEKMELVYEFHGCEYHGCPE